MEESESIDLFVHFNPKTTPETRFAASPRWARSRVSELTRAFEEGRMNEESMLTATELRRTAIYRVTHEALRSFTPLELMDEISLRGASQYTPQRRMLRFWIDVEMMTAKRFLVTGHYVEYANMMDAFERDASRAERRFIGDSLFRALDAYRNHQFYSFLEDENWLEWLGTEEETDDKALR